MVGRGIRSTSSDAEPGAVVAELERLRSPLVSASSEEHLRPVPLVLLTLAILPACDTSSDTTLERIRDDRFIRAAYSPEPPYAFVDSAGEVTGESPSALRAVVEDLALGEIRWVRADFQDLIPLLRAGRVDVIASGLFRTPEREELVRFSVPTVCASAALVVAPGSPVSSLEAFVADSTRRLAVMLGSVEEKASSVLEIDPAQLVRVPDLTTGIAAVAEGRADALAITLPTARTAVSRQEASTLDVRTYEPPAAAAALLTGCSALAFRRGDERLARDVDAVLSGYIGSAAHLQVISAFGFTAADLPQDER